LGFSCKKHNEIYPLFLTSKPLFLTELDTVMEEAGLSYQSSASPRLCVRISSVKAFSFDANG
jgi:hypothetical protein